MKPETEQTCLHALQTNLKLFSATIDKLEAIGERMEPHVRLRYLQQIDTLRSGQQIAWEKIRALKLAGEEMRHELEAETDIAVRVLVDAVDSVASEYC